MPLVQILIDSILILLCGGLVYECHLLRKQILSIKESIKSPVIQVQHSEHIICIACHSVVAKYNPTTQLCANCDYDGYIKSRIE